MKPSKAVSKDFLKLLKLYKNGLTLYRERNFTEALKSFKAALEIDPFDGPSQLYSERCEAYIQTPPPKDWDGVFTMTSK